MPNWMSDWNLHKVNELGELNNVLVRPDMLDYLAKNALSATSAGTVPVVGNLNVWRVNVTDTLQLATQTI